LALFKGNLKLVKNLPPVGDGLWHLYDLGTDPGETQDLQVQMPDAYRNMQSDYDAYAKAHGVLPIPDGYRPGRQVFMNSMRNYWIPAYGAKVFLALVGLIAVTVYLVRSRRSRRRS
jgi:hypothetical protein